MNLNQVTLPVKNLRECNQFYLKMGFTQIVDSPHYARFVCEGNGSTFSLLIDDNNFNNGAVIYFEEEKLDEWVCLLQQRGLHFEHLLKDESYLWREATLTDPSGNKVKLYWAGKNRINPPWKVSIKYKSGE